MMTILRGNPSARSIAAKSGGVLVFAGLALAGGPLLAQSTSTDFVGAETLVLQDFIASVEIVTTEADQISVSIDNGKAGKEPVLVERRNGRVEVFSRTAPQSRDFWRRINWRRHGDKAFGVFMADYPKVQISVPEGTDIEVAGVAALLNVATTNGDFVVGKTVHVEGTIGDIESGDIRITGAGDLTFGSVAQMLKAGVSGSGSLAFSQSGPATLGVSGSGDIRIGNVAGDVKAKVSGSGDIDVGDIDGAGRLAVSGSGDIRTGDIARGLEVAIRGSGDIVVAAMDGPGVVSISGSGDVAIRKGRAEGMDVTIRGSGDFDFGGLATNPVVSVSGSGDVFIKAYEGKVKAKGRGDIKIGDLVIEN